MRVCSRGYSSFKRERISSIVRHCSIIVDGMEFKIGLNETRESEKISLLFFSIDKLFT